MQQVTKERAKARAKQRKRDEKKRLRIEKKRIMKAIGPPKRRRPVIKKSMAQIGVDKNFWRQKKARDVVKRVCKTTKGKGRMQANKWIKKERADAYIDSPRAYARCNRVKKGKEPTGSYHKTSYPTRR